MIFGADGFTGSMPLFTTNHSFRAFGGPEALRSITNFKKCGVQVARVVAGMLCLECPSIALLQHLNQHCVGHNADSDVAISGVQLWGANCQMLIMLDEQEVGLVVVWLWSCCHVLPVCLM